MSNHKFPSFNFPYTPSEDLRQFLVDYGRTGLVHVFKDGQNIECIPQKKEMNENKMVRLISEKPTLPLNLPYKISDELDMDFSMEFEQPVTNLISDHGGIVFGRLAELAGAEAAKSSWSTPQSLPYLTNTTHGKTMLDPLLKRFENNFCDVPLGLLTDLVQETCQEDKMTATGKHYGNCLAYAQSQESGIVLVYPGGTTMNELCFSDLEINSSDEGLARLSTRKGSFSLPERICQISTGNEIDQSCVIAVRTEHKCWLFKNGSCEIKQKPTFLGNLQCKSRPCATTVSPYIPEEVVVAMESGSLWLWSAEDSSVEVVRQCSACTSEDFDWYFSEFGSHPRQVVRGNQKNVELIDLRVAGGGSSTSQDLMTLPSPHFFSDDKFTTIQHNHDNPFHYFLATTKSLVIMDERFQQHPVLKWSHSLEYPPKYINVLADPRSQDVLVFVGSYESHEVHCFQYCYGEHSSYPLAMADDVAGILPPRSTSTPWKISSYSEWSEMLDYQNKAQSYPSVNQRLNQPLHGLACIPSQSNTTPLTILQLSGVGDLFYQSLFPRESKLTEVRDEGRALFYEDLDLDLTSSGGYGSRKHNLSKEDEEFIAKWVECLMEHVDKESRDLLEELGGSCHTEDVSSVREHLLFSSLEMVAECRLCCGEDLMDTSGSSDDTGEVCLHCGLTRELADQLYEVKISQGRVLTKEYLGVSYTPETLEMFDVHKQYSEPLGNILLKNWNCDEQIAIVLTEGQQDTAEDVKQNVNAWLETGQVTERDEDGRSPLKKCLVTTPNQQTAVKKEHTTSGGKLRDLNHETKTRSPNINSLWQSPKTPKRTSNSNRAFQSTTRQDNLGSPYTSQDIHVISSQEIKNLRTPDSKTFPKSQAFLNTTPTLANTLSPNASSPRAVGQSRTPTNKKIARVPGF